MKTKDRITEQLLGRFHMTSHIWRKKVAYKTCKLCWQDIELTLILGVHLKTNKNFNIGVIIASLFLGND